MLIVKSAFINYLHIMMTSLYFLCAWMLICSVSGKLPNDKQLHNFLDVDSHQIMTGLSHLVSQEINITLAQNASSTETDYKGKPGFRYGGQWMCLYRRKVAYILTCIKERFNITRTEMAELLSILQRERPDSPLLRMNASTMDTCPYKHIPCDAGMKYRTLDGSCNNLRYPLWGKALIPLHNDLPPDYADGFDAPRVSASGSPLPFARSISLKIFEDKDRPSRALSFLFMAFGQLLAHDTGLTGLSVLLNDTNQTAGHRRPVCGYDECQTDGIENEQCFPIQLPDNEPVFTNRTCLFFVRSLPVSDLSCNYGPRRQLNQITSFIDASFVYGSSDEEALFLRDLNQTGRGMLKTSGLPHPHWQPLLPTAEVPDCKGTNQSIKCFLAGDPRVNEHVTLISLHTVFVRLHSIIESKLHDINQHWDGNRLYQETRKIVGAVVQHITYNEYLPLVVGDELMAKFNLKPLRTGYWNKYDERIRPDATNAFQTAAFRFGHSLIGNSFRLMQDSNTPFRDVNMTEGFFRPHELYLWRNVTGVDSTLFGMFMKPIQKADQFFTHQVTKSLFTKTPPDGLGTDLVSLNIQRGRDHGLPGYNSFRRWCGLPAGTNFTNLPGIAFDVRLKLGDLYESVEDIDLFVGGLLEEQLPGAVVGPTFGCIIANQFRSLRFGDRFWYETGHPGISFSLKQLSEIRKVRFAKILSDCSDDIHHIQPWALLQPGTKTCLDNSTTCKFNKIMPCDEYDDTDLTAWTDPN